MQTIEAKDQSIGAKEQSMEIEFLFVDAEGQVASTGDHFASTAEHFVPRSSSASSIEGIFSFEAFHSFSIEGRFFSEKGKACWERVYFSSQKEKPISIEEVPSSIDCKVGAIDCKVGAIDCFLCSTDARPGPFEARLPSIEAPVPSIEPSFASLEGAASSAIAALTPLTRDRSHSHNAPGDLPACPARATRWIPSRVQDLGEVGQKRGRRAPSPGRRGPIVTRGVRRSLS